jgi:hypothetical protein
VLFLQHPALQPVHQIYFIGITGILMSPFVMSSDQPIEAKENKFAVEE